MGKNAGTATHGDACRGTNGKVLTQGHHRWAAAQLTGAAIPVEIIYYMDYLDAGLAVPFTRAWTEVVWKRAQE
jgi:hypothetical protein